MADVLIWHNPRCRKSREGLQYLRDKGIEPEVYEYLSDPPDAAKLTDVVEKLGVEPRALLRTKETEYRELALKDAAKTADDVIAAMVAHPKLIERPIVVKGDRAVVGRPVEEIEKVL